MRGERPSCESLPLSIIKALRATLQGSTGVAGMIPLKVSETWAEVRYFKHRSKMKQTISVAHFNTLQLVGHYVCTGVSTSAVL